MNRTGFIYHDDFLLHLTGEGHPERPDRLVALVDHLRNSDLYRDLIHLKPRQIEPAIVELIHPASYIREVQNACKSGLHYLDSDTVVSKKSYEVALLAAGGAIEGCRCVVDGEVDNVFCASRPPGHHAEPSRSMGFCLFNSIAIASRWLQRHRKMGRVCIVDWDVHHGNGTQAAFYDDPTVFYISVHQHPLYPGTGNADETGIGNAEGTNLNIPVPPGYSDDDYIRIFERKISPAISDFLPEFLLISAGFDAHERDPLAQMQLTEFGFAKLTKMICDLADEFCEGRVVSLLEGGYDLDGLSRSVQAHLAVLLDK